MDTEKAHCPDSPYMVNMVGEYSRELDILLSRSAPRKYRSGSVVFMQGEPGGRFYFIKKGRVMVTIVGRDGSEKIVAIQESNTFVGDTSLDRYPYPATAVAIQDSEIYAVEQAHFRLCVKSNPEVAFMILESVIRKARSTALQVGDLSLRTARGRVAHVLVKLSEEIGRKTEEGIVIQERMTHGTLAGLTGLARPTLTSLLNELERSNLISKTKNSYITIVDKERLVHAVDNIVD